MNSYSISIAIDSAGVTQINDASQRVTLAKKVSYLVTSANSVTNHDTGYPPPVVWIAFAPFENNLISWTQDYEIYASSTPVCPCTTIIESSSTRYAVQPQYLYTLSGGAFDSGAPDSSIPAEHYGAQNSNGETLQFGLSQSATVNNAALSAPLNIVTVLNNETVLFAPIERIFVFLSSVSENGVIIPYIPSTAASASLTEQAPTASFTFNDFTNTFSPA